MLADGFSLQSEWQQVLSLQDSFQYSGSYQCVVWMVYTHSLISKSSSSCTNPLVTVPSTLITIGITITFMFHSFIQLSSKVYVFISLFILLVLPCDQPEWQSPLFGRFSFLLIITRSSHLAKIRWSICIQKKKKKKKKKRWIFLHQF